MEHLKWTWDGGAWIKAMKCKGGRVNRQLWHFMFEVKTKIPNQQLGIFVLALTVLWDYYLPKSSCTRTISSSSEGLLASVCCQISAKIPKPSNPIKR